MPPTKATSPLPLLCLVPAALLGVVWLMDSLPVAQDGRVAIALVDEPAHLSTALIILLAAGGPRLSSRHRTFFVSAAAGAVLIDLDHVPLYAGVPGLSLPGGRPYSHSLATPAALALLAWALPRARELLLGFSCGTLLHLVRDVATGPGLPLFWPLDNANQLLPYASYFTAISCAAVVATARLRSAARADPRHFSASSPVAAANGLANDLE